MFWKLHIFQGVKMSSTWFCMVGPWRARTKKTLVMIAFHSKYQIFGVWEKKHIFDSLKDKRLCSKWRCLQHGFAWLDLDIAWLVSKFFGGNENCFTGEHCSDVIPLYRPTAREINLMTNSQICRFYVFSFAKCKIDGRASKELFPLNIQYILKAICLIHKKEGYQKLCRAHDYRIFCRLFRGLQLAG